MSQTQAYRGSAWVWAIGNETGHGGSRDRKLGWDAYRTRVILNESGNGGLGDPKRGLDVWAKT